MEGNWNPTSLCICGGNLTIESILGSILFFEQKGILNSVKLFSSTGNGCIVSILLYLGFKATQIRKLIAKIGFYTFMDSIVYCDKKDSNGLVNDTSFIHFFTPIFEDKYGFIPTMNQLYLNTGKIIYLSYYNFTTGELGYISKKTYPDMDVITAMRLSCNAPYVTFDIFLEGDVIMDACSNNPMPISCFDSKERCLIIYTRQKRNYLNERSFDELHKIMKTLSIDEIMKNSFRHCIGLSLFLTLNDSDVRHGFEESKSAYSYLLESNKKNVQWPKVNKY